MSGDAPGRSPPRIRSASAKHRFMPEKSFRKHPLNGSPLAIRMNQKKSTYVPLRQGNVEHDRLDQM